MSGWHDTLPPEANVNDFAAITNIVYAMLSRMRTGTLVKVVGVTNDGGVSPIGTVDITPLVNLMDGNRQATSHGTIYKCPYLRIGGGSNAVILDPQVGDIGFAVFADRDIQSALANKGPANPGSARMFDWADGVYLYTVVSATPTQFVQFNTDGIRIKSPTLVKVEAPDVQVVSDTAEVTTTGATTVQADSVSVTTTGDITVSAGGDLTATVGGSASVTATVAITYAAPTMTFTVDQMTFNITAGWDIFAPPSVQGGGMGTTGVNFLSTVCQNAGHELKQF